MKKEENTHAFNKNNHIPETLIKHVLPKANEIVKTAEQVIKSIYPFVMPSSPFQCGFDRVEQQPYKDSLDSQYKLTPRKKRIM
jgi:hypothetical protein